MIEFIPHSKKQDDAVFSDNRILLLATGTQWGKSRVGALRMKMKMHEFTKSTDSFLVTAPTYKIMAQASMPAFMQFMNGFGVYDKKFDVFRMHNGGSCYFRTETDPDSIVGITDVKHIWADEAGKYGLYFWENIQARAEFCGCSIDLTTSPYSINWIFRELIKPKQKGLRPDVDYITAASWENPYHSLHNPEKRALKEATMDPRRFKMVFGGEFEKMEGLVYDCFDENNHVVKPFELPSGTKFYGGIDWGFNPDPFALVIMAILPNGLKLLISEFKKTRLIISEQVRIAQMKMKMWPIERFYADPSRNDSIEYFCQNGVPTVGADNSISKGIDFLYQSMKENQFKCFDTCSYFLDEVSNYHFPEEKDLGPDDNEKEQLPVDANNHILDALRYVHTMTYRSNIKHTPKSNEETKRELPRDIQARLKQLKKLKNNFPGSENFS